MKDKNKRKYVSLVGIRIPLRTLANCSFLRVKTPSYFYKFQFKLTLTRAENKKSADFPRVQI